MNWFTRIVSGRGTKLGLLRFISKQTDLWFLLLTLLALLISFLLMPIAAGAQTIVPYSGQVIAPTGVLASNVPVRVCLTSSTGTPCSTTGVPQLYSDAAHTNPIQNPTSTNAYGIFQFWTNNNLYHIQIQVGPTTTYNFYVSSGSGGTTAYYQVMEQDGSPSLQQLALNFIGATGLHSANNYGNFSTDLSLSAIPNSSLANSAITINGSSVPLGGTITITAAGTAGGDLCGTYPNPTVCKVNNAALPASTTYIGTNAQQQVISAPDAVQINPAAVQTVIKPLRVTDLMLPLTAVTGFGDSNMNAYGLANPANGWFQRLSAYMNWTLNNKAISGGMCGDDGPVAFSETPGTGSNYNVNLFYNDMRVNGTNSTKVLESHACMVAMVGKLGIPNTQFVSAQTPQTVSGLPGCLYTGSWSNVTLTGTNYSIPEKFSNLTGSTITCVTPPGQTAYVYMLHQAGNASNQFTVSVDGVTQPCNAGENVCFDDHTWTEFATSGTYLGQQYWPLGIRLANLTGNDYHTVVINVVNAGVGGMHVLGVSAASSASGGQLMPQVMLAEVPRMNAAGYAAGFIGSNASLALYNEHAHTIGSQAAQDGLQVHLIDLSAAEVLDPNDPANMQSDNVHFSEIGHGRIFNAYLSEYSPLLYPRDRGAGMQFRNVAPYKNSLYVGGVPAGAAAGEVGSTTGASTGRITLGGDHCGISRESSTVYQIGGGCTAGITLLQGGGASSAFPALSANPSGSPEWRAVAADNSGTIPITAKNLFLSTTPVTFTGLSAGITSVTCNAGYTCNSKGGTLAIVSNTFTTGTIVNVVWPTTLGSQNCMTSQNGGATWLGFSNTSASSTGFTLTNTVSIAGTTQFVTYSCVPVF